MRAVTLLPQSLRTAVGPASLLALVVASAALVMAPGRAQAGPYLPDSGHIEVSNLRPYPGETITVTGDGFAPQAAVALQIMTADARTGWTPSAAGVFAAAAASPDVCVFDLGRTAADGAGIFSAEATIPPCLAAGEYRLQASGLAPDGGTHLLSATLDVGALSAPASGPSRWLVAALAALGLLLAADVALRLRRAPAAAGADRVSPDAAASVSEPAAAADETVSPEVPAEAAPEGQAERGGGEEGTRTALPASGVLAGPQLPAAAAQARSDRRSAHRKAKAARPEERRTRREAAEEARNRRKAASLEEKTAAAAAAAEQRRERAAAKDAAAQARRDQKKARAAARETAAQARSEAEQAESPAPDAVLPGHPGRPAAPSPAIPPLSAPAPPPPQTAVAPPSTPPPAPAGAGPRRHRRDDRRRRRRSSRRSGEAPPSPPSPSGDPWHDWPEGTPPGSDQP